MQKARKINQIKKLTLGKLGITERRLNQRVVDLTQKRPLTREQALWIIAQESGVTMSKHLSKEELRELREIMETKLDSNTPGILKREVLIKRLSPEATKNKSMVRRSLSWIEENPLYRILTILTVIFGVIGAFYLFFR